jgi:hypothetical protein
MMELYRSFTLWVSGFDGLKLLLETTDAENHTGLRIVTQQTFGLSAHRVGDRLAF